MYLSESVYSILEAMSCIFSYRLKLQTDILQSSQQLQKSFFPLSTLMGKIALVVLELSSSTTKAKLF